jgi:hypothetical protein
MSSGSDEDLAAVRAKQQEEVTRDKKRGQAMAHLEALKADKHPLLVSFLSAASIMQAKRCLVRSI